jgi:DNA helicase II / ATP-dependent DNA helicase PcrA
MTNITEQDIDSLAAFFPELSLTDSERRAVLLCADTVDVQAAPGSGKTTLLAIKLALLASQWNESHRGICILSHTNVAQTEIEQRIAKIPGGKALLQYPHYVGTIQTFVHTFLALPVIRSHGLQISCIDNDRFSRRIKSDALGNKTVQSWLKAPGVQRSKVLAGLRFEGPELALGSAEGEVPKSGVTLPELQELKWALARDGFFRFDDMFAFAQHALLRWPSTPAFLSHRFPLVFLDEMQDTDSLAENVLHQAFKKQVVVQRFGDINQAILSSASSSPISFPHEPSLNVSTSMRFGPEIANLVSKLALDSSSVSGVGESSILPITFLSYSDTSITEVIYNFGELVAKNVDESILKKGVCIKAICARQKPPSAQRTGSHIREYWPSYVHQGSVLRPMRQTIAQLFISASRLPSSTSQLTSHFECAQLALLRLLRLAKCPWLGTEMTFRQVEALWGKSHPCLLSLRMLVIELVTNSSGFDGNKLQSFIRRFCVELAEWLPENLHPETLIDEEELQIEPHFDEVREAADSEANICIIKDGDKTFPIEISTIASVKGETHYATLILESFNTNSFDITSILPLLCGDKDLSNYDTRVLRAHVKNLFVAASRPTKILCFALHRDRLRGYEQKIRNLGWHIKEV